MGGAQSQARSTGREVFSGNTNGGCGAMLTVTAGAKSSIMSDEPSTASISAGATKPATTAQVQSIAKQENRKSNIRGHPPSCCVTPQISAESLYFHHTPVSTIVDRVSANFNVNETKFKYAETKFR